MIYCFACHCGNKFVSVRTVHDCNKPAVCPECQKQAARDFIAEHRETVHHPGDWPLKSSAAGVHPTQAKEATELAAKRGVPTEFTKDGDAVFTSARHRKAYCEAFGMYDRNGGYNDPQKQVTVQKKPSLADIGYVQDRGVWKRPERQF